MDIRSFSLNFEVNAFIFDNQLSEELNKEFYNDLKYCDEILYDEYKKRSNIVKIKESFSRLISPML
jgi:cardiolipin synthase